MKLFKLCANDRFDFRFDFIASASHEALAHSLLLIFGFLSISDHLVAPGHRTEGMHRVLVLCSLDRARSCFLATASCTWTKGLPRLGWDLDGPTHDQ